MKKKHKKIEIGDRFGKLVIAKMHKKDERHRIWWECVCDCGNKTILHTGNLNSGNTKSCGCLVKESALKRRISDNHSEITAIILGYKRHAIDRGFNWELTREYVKDLIKSDCYYCGSPPSNTKKTKNSLGSGLKYSGIDRINSDNDYTEDNVVPCCRICNYAKSNMNISDFKEWAIKLGKRAMAEQWG